MHTYAALVASAHDQHEIGRVTITRPGASTMTAPIHFCQSGELAFFEGVDLAGIDPAVTMRVAIDPMAGPRIQLDALVVGAPWMLEPSVCSTWDVSITRTNSRYNNVRELDVGIAVACALPDGAQVELRTAARCSVAPDVFTVRHEIDDLRPELSR